MRKDLNSLKRRPFLFPLLMPVTMMALVAVVAVWVFDARATTVVVLVRSAEAEASSEPDPKPDPNLSLVGKERAARLARVLSQLQVPRAIDTVLAADTRRAQQTVQPLAEALALPTNVVPPSEWPTMANRIRSDHRGEVVLVAGDVKQLAEVIEELTGEAVKIAESDYDRLYVIFSPQLSRTRMLRLAY